MFWLTSFIEFSCYVSLSGRVLNVIKRIDLLFFLSRLSIFTSMHEILFHKVDPYTSVRLVFWCSFHSFLWTTHINFTLLLTWEYLSICCTEKYSAYIISCMVFSLSTVSCSFQFITGFFFNIMSIFRLNVPTCHLCGLLNKLLLCFACAVHIYVV